jgi:hypothetical protein
VGWLALGWPSTTLEKPDPVAMAAAASLLVPSSSSAGRSSIALKSCASERKTPEKPESGLVWTLTDEEEKSVQEAMAALFRGEEGSTKKFLMMLCVLFLKQTHRQNRIEGKRQEAEPVSVSLLHPDAGMHPSTRRSSTQSSRSGNRLNSQGKGHVFKKYGREEEQPWMQHKRGEKGTGQKYPAEQTEATVEAAGEAEQKERRKLNLIIR